MKMQQKKRTKRQEYIWGDKRLIKLQDYCPGKLMPTEEENLRELKEYLDQQPFLVLCSMTTNDFLNRMILTGRMHKLKCKLERYSRKYPCEAYILDDNFGLTMGILVREEDI